MIFTEHFHLKATEYTFFSRAHGTFFRIDDILEHIISLGKFNKIDIISSIFSNQNATKLEMNSKEKKSAESKHMEAKQYAIKQPIDQRRNKKVVKRY